MKPLTPNSVRYSQEQGDLVRRSAPRRRVVLVKDQKAGPLGGLRFPPPPAGKTPWGVRRRGRGSIFHPVQVDVESSSRLRLAGSPGSFLPGGVLVGAEIDVLAPDDERIEQLLDARVDQRSPPQTLTTGAPHSSTAARHLRSTSAGPIVLGIFADPAAALAVGGCRHELGSSIKTRGNRFRPAQRCLSRYPVIERVRERGNRTGRRGIGDWGLGIGDWGLGIGGAVSGGACPCADHSPRRHGATRRRGEMNHEDTTDTKEEEVGRRWHVEYGALNPHLPHATYHPFLRVFVPLW